MLFFNKISIKYKIVLIILLTNIIIVTIGLFLEIYYTKVSLEKRYIADIGNYTRVAGEQCITAIDFDFKEDAERELKTLNPTKSIKHAYLFNAKNILFAEYHLDSLKKQRIKVPILNKNINFYSFINDTLIIQKEILFEGEKRGSIIVVSDTKISEEIRKRYISVGLVSLGLIAFAFILASYLQQFISVPILKLSDIVNSISEKKDYSVRIKNHYKDEIGTLNIKINNFLDVIQNRELERDNAELALRISEDRFRSLAELLPETVFEVDSNLNFSFINKSAQLIFNYSENEIQELNFKKILIPEELPKLNHTIKKLMKEKKAISSEFIAIKKNGNQFPTLIYVSPIYLHNSLNGFRGILIDITELKNAQNQIEQLNKHLEQRVIARTKKLAKANKELADVSYISAHDLKTPIRGISQIASWILDDYKECLDSGLIKNINLISNRASHMNKLVNGILEYTDIGRGKINIEEFDLNEILETIKTNKISNKNIAFKIIGGSIKLNYHKEHLIVIFSHLIDNSMKFNENEQIKIEIEVTGTDNNRNFSLKDNGIGIDEKYRNSIFGIFKTLSSDYNNQNIGIGLALVKKIVELYSGEIAINSQNKEKGTRVSFNLEKTQIDHE